MKTYELRRSKNGRSVFLTTDAPPDQWSSEYIDMVFKATGQRGIKTPTRRRVHFTPPDPHQEKIIVFEVDPTPLPNPILHQFAHPTCLPRVPTIPHRRPHISCNPKPRVPIIQPRRPHIPCNPKQSRCQIFFHDKHTLHYSFTNFSKHDVYYGNKRYPSSEHLFQSLKFAHKPHLAEYIRTCSPSPKVARSEAIRLAREVRPDWKQVEIQVMTTVLFHKFTQHCSLRNELLATGDAELIESSISDPFWGAGLHGEGRNELGKALERIRRRLQSME